MRKFVIGISIFTLCLSALLYLDANAAFDAEFSTEAAIEELNDFRSSMKSLNIGEETQDIILEEYVKAIKQAKVVEACKSKIKLQLEENPSAINKCYSSARELTNDESPIKAASIESMLSQGQTSL